LKIYKEESESCKNPRIYRNRKSSILFCSYVLHYCERRQPTSERQSYRSIQQKQCAKVPFNYWWYLLVLLFLQKLFT